MIELKIGMYVRCPVDTKDTDSRQFLLGQIVKIDEFLNIVEVRFNDLYNMGIFFSEFIEKREFDIETITRCKIISNSKVLYRDKYEGIILSNYNDKDKSNYYKYYVKINEEIVLLEEKDIKVHFNRDDINVINQLARYEFHNPIWHQCRSYVSDYVHAVKNSPNGIESMLGSRVYLLPHQIDTIMTVVNERECRFMLADEVGLGKTIEASVILKYLKDKNKKLKSLIIVPDSLIYQWKTELEYKFWLDVSIERINQNSDIVLYPLEKINTNYANWIYNEKWDLLIVDETHRTISMDQEYNKILELSKKIESVLLITATPIQQRKSEYLKFLKILKPSYYENMSEEVFEQLLKKQLNIRKTLYDMMRDLDAYYSDDLAEYYEEDLQDVAEELNDDVLNEIIDEIDIKSEDKGLEIVKLALAYLGEYYQIERQIIRHRRIELRDQLPKRKLKEVKYNQIGSELNFYERDVSEEIHKYLQQIAEENPDSSYVGQFIKELLSALYSSPWALEFMLKKRLFSVKNNIYFESDEVSDLNLLNTPRKEEERRTNLAMYIASFEGEFDTLEYIMNLNKKWISATLREFETLDELYNDPDLIKGKFLKMLDYITENYEEEKIVIFTSWKQTAERLEELLKLKFGSNSCVSFHAGKNDEELQYSADKFQSDESCKFIVCDELGGEGRNFQIADSIIHFDMPWSPIILEQRIGRLDRVGRDTKKDVISVVVYSEDTVEESLFKIWNESLNVFEESLSGLELVFEEIQNKILDTIKDDVRYGLNKIFDDISDYIQQMKEYVEEEQYLDVSRHLGRDKVDKINQILDKFSEKNGNRLNIVMNRWANLIGFTPTKLEDEIYGFLPQKFQKNAFKNTLFTIPNMENTRKRTKNTKNIKGTFSRRKAIEREDLIFFAPSDQFFDSIIDNAMEVDRGRCCAFMNSSSVEWKGIILKWNIDVNLQNIIEKNKEALKYIKRDYMPMEHIYTIHPFDGYENIENENVIDLYYESLSADPKKLIHIGKRSGKNVRLVNDNSKSNIEWFKHNYPRSIWIQTVKEIYHKGYNEAMEIIKSMDIRSIAKKDFEKNINAMKSVNRYYKYNRKQNQESLNNKIQYYNLVLSNLKVPKLTLDSAIVMFLDGEKNE